MQPQLLPRATRTTTTTLHRHIRHIALSRRLRRYSVLLLPLLLSAWFTWLYYLRPSWQERRMLDGLLDRAAENSLGGGGNMRPEFRDLVFLRHLDPALLPGPGRGHEKRRLVFVGDVHGCLEELEALLKVVGFDQERDHLLAVGDVVNKGPDSAGVVDLLMRLKASCVRGNHEDRMLLEWTAAASSSATMEQLTLEDEASPPPPPPSASEKSPKKKPLYTQFTPSQLNWLASLPVILHIGPIASQTYVLVHAGLAPTVPLDRQDPFQVMNMRSIHKASLLPSEDRDAGSPWDAVWNRAMARLVAEGGKTREGIEVPLTVVYGHDAKRGLSIRPYSKGLDSGCVRGGRLTALVVDARGRTRVFGVECRGYLAAKGGKEKEEKKGKDDKKEKKGDKKEKKGDKKEKKDEREKKDKKDKKEEKGEDTTKKAKKKAQKTEVEAEKG